MAELSETMQQIYQKANTDADFREKLCQDPVATLASFDITVVDPERLIVEYHDDYGIFIGLPREANKKPSADSDQYPKEQLSTLNDCLHY